MKCCSGFSSFSVSFWPGFERRQLVLQLLVFFVLAFLGFFVDLQEAVELQHRSGHAEPEAVAAACLASMSTVVWSNTAGIICDATKRCQISL